MKLTQLIKETKEQVAKISLQIDDEKKAKRALIGAAILTNLIFLPVMLQIVQIFQLCPNFYWLVDNAYFGVWLYVPFYLPLFNFLYYLFLKNYYAEIELLQSLNLRHQFLSDLLKIGVWIGVAIFLIASFVVRSIW